MNGMDEEELRTIVIHGKRTVLPPIDSSCMLKWLIPAMGRRAALRAKRQCDRDMQDLSDALWLREFGTIAGAHVGRKPSAKAVRLSKIKPGVE